MVRDDVPDFRRVLADQGVAVVVEEVGDGIPKLCFLAHLLQGAAHGIDVESGRAERMGHQVGGPTLGCRVGGVPLAQRKDRVEGVSRQMAQPLSRNR